jgi:hypothetical protein
MPESLPVLSLDIEPKFPLGHLVATPGVIENILHEDIQSALNRHASGDWGELCTHDRRANNRALIEGQRLLSAYDSKDKTRFWIITEWDRSVTTILLPMEY